MPRGRPAVRVRRARSSLRPLVPTRTLAAFTEYGVPWWGNPSIEHGCQDVPGLRRPREPGRVADRGVGDGVLGDEVQHALVEAETPQRGSLADYLAQPSDGPDRDTRGRRLLLGR